MNYRKMQFIGQLPQSIGVAATVQRNFTSCGGFWTNTLLKRMPNNSDNCAVQSSGARRGFQLWVKDKKDDYRTKKDVSTKQHIIDGFKMLKSELKLWKAEAIEHLQVDPLLVYRPGEFRALNVSVSVVLKKG